MTEQAGMDFIRFTIVVSVVIFVIADTSAQEISTVPETSSPSTVQDIATPLDQTTTEQTMTEQTTAEQITAEQITAEQTTAEQTTADQTTTEQTTAEQTTAEQTTAEQTTVEQTTAEQTTVEQTTAEQTTAEKIQSMCEKEKQNAIASNDVFVPECTISGEYDHIQCQCEDYSNEKCQNVNPACWCVDKKGKKIVGTTKPVRNQVTCSVDPEKTPCENERLKAMISKTTVIPNCTDEGAFRVTQCNTDKFTCWCVDSNGQKIPGTEKINQTIDCETGMYFPPCTAALLKYSTDPTSGTYYPRCTPTGEFEKMHCHGSLCYCVDRNGNQIKGTTVPVWETPKCPDLPEPCLKHRKKAIESWSKFVPNCTENGEYEKTQCKCMKTDDDMKKPCSEGKRCWCSDKYGIQIPGTDTWPDKREIDCETGTGFSPCIAAMVNHAYQPILRIFKPRCIADGDFDRTQCHGLVCYCLDLKGKRILGSEVPVWQKPTCAGNNYTSCKQHKSEMTAVKNDYIPGCTLDGYYEKIQCECKKLKSSLDCSGYLDTTCWCSDKYGTTIPGAISSGAFADCKTGKSFSSCVKRLLHFVYGNEKDVPRPRCNKGKYDTVQCRGLKCYCADKENGRKVSGVNGPLWLKPHCLDMKVMPCTNHSEKAKELRQAFVPVCTANGNYKLEQCICEGVDAHKREECRGVQTQCWCIDKHGDQITSTVVHDRKYLDCRTGKYFPPCVVASLNYAHDKVADSYKPHCTSCRDYEPLQCHGPYCFCVDQKGRKIEGTGRPVWEEESKCPEIPSSSCNKQNEDAIAKKRAYIPQCTVSGQFKRMQCRCSKSYEPRHKECLGIASECWCVDKYGNQIYGTAKINVTSLECSDQGIIFPLCVRALLRVHYSPRSDNEYRPRCLSTGNFMQEQCHLTQCYCVHSNGTKVSGTEVPNWEKPHCQEPLMSCNDQQDYASRKQLGFVPECAKGEYVKVQCQCETNDKKTLKRCASLTKKCWCADRYGTKIWGTIADSRNEVHCEAVSKYPRCVRELLNYFYNTSTKPAFKPRCTIKGKYEPIQCNSNKCFCVDENGKRIDDKDTPLTEIPRCKDKKYHSCEKQREIAIQLDLNFLPNCTSSGEFTPEQCMCARESTYHNYVCVILNGAYCWCVDKHGKEVPGSFQKTTTSFHCKSERLFQACSLALMRYNDNMLGGDKPRCKPNGEFEPIQCNGSLCYCVDRNGKPLLGTYVPLCETPVCPENIEQSCNEQQLEATRLNRAYIPQCTSDGLFEKVQCQCEGDRTDSGMPCEYIPSSCWCADVKYGQAINGTVQRSRSDMDCETGKYFTHCVAELLQFHYRYIDLPGAAKPRCKANGEYESMQCSGSVCYCVTAIGVIIPGSSVPLWAKPRCKDVDVSHCIKERDNALHLKRVYVPRCESNGDYAKMQCECMSGNSHHTEDCKKITARCWCSNSYGEKITGTAHTDPLKVDCETGKFDPPCIVDLLKYMYSTEGIVVFKPRCTELGHYLPKQCHGEMCYCVDKKGSKIEGTEVDKLDPGTLHCADDDGGRLIMDCMQFVMPKQKTNLMCSFFTGTAPQVMTLSPPHNKRPLFSCYPDRLKCDYHGKPWEYTASFVGANKVLVTINSFSIARDAGMWTCSDLSKETKTCHKIVLSPSHDAAPSLLTNVSIILQLVAVKMIATPPKCVELSEYTDSAHTEVEEYSY